MKRGPAGGVIPQTEITLKISEQRKGRTFGGLKYNN
jgi:hypothetical protein